MKAIGLDIGTTSICGIRINCEDGTVDKTISRSNDSWINTKNAWEKIQDPEIICGKVNEILEELYEKGIKVIGVTGQMHGILYADRNGMSVSPLYTWQDGRGNLPYEGTTYADYVHSYTGYGNVTHFYNEKNGLIPENAAVFCTIHDYIVMRLTGRKTPFVHSSDAASFGLYDMKANKFTVSNAFQPEVTPDIKIAGEWNGIPVSVAIGDNQASFFGCGCGENTVLVNVGTGSQVSLMTDDMNAHDGMEIRPLYADKFITVGCSLCGGRAYAILERFFRETAAMAGVKAENLYDAMLCEAKKTSETDLVFNTLFCGTRDEPERRAEILNLSADNFTPGNFVRGCLNGIVAELFDLYKKSEKKCTRLVASGNGVRKNPELKRTIEETFKIKLLTPVYCEEAAMGAAVFALTAVGIFKNIENAERILRYDL